MTETVTHRMSAEGTDPLILGGVNDANLLALEESTGVRVSMRGEQLTLAGELEAVRFGHRSPEGMRDVAEECPLPPVALVAEGQPPLPSPLQRGGHLQGPGGHEVDEAVPVLP